MTTTAWSGRKVTEARQILANATTWPTECARGCGRTLTRTDPWRLGHRLPRWSHPELTWEPTNWQVECRPCSDASGQAEALAKARAEGHALAVAGFPLPTTPEQSPPLPEHTHGAAGEAVEARGDLSWASLCLDAPSWLSPYLVVPEDAAPPLWVSPVHVDATGSYGAEAIEWIEANLTERGRPLVLRWWQRLALVLQLQHRSDGSLCFRVILESGPRRIGKSVRLRGGALWRLACGPDLFEPHQLVLHTGKDLAIVREVLRKAWPWADAQEEWNSKRGMTEPEISYLGVNRWVARSKDATTGYDGCLALVDEAWDVPASAIDDDLEPTMLERESPQLVLTSTAHRKATSLMRGRIVDVLAADDGETLILLWGAPADADAGDPVVWRAASPHWSADRAAMMASKYAKALAGEQDPEFDDPDPMQGFRCQYLNQWPLRQRRAARGAAVVTEAAWRGLELAPPVAVPDGAAVESWFAEGVSLALAWRAGGRAVVSVSDHADLAGAVAAVRESGFRGRVIVGASQMKDPALAGVRKVKGEGRTLASVQALGRLLTEDALRHDGGEHLTDQVLAARTLPGADGPRMVSSGRADAVKAAVWAVEAARARGRGLLVVTAKG